ncbi:hypothetical protein NL108_017974 [Boleophthalmus pectinirostris]|nr:hypothetical protein NL108_017974 [Boleophthalmus pectinirostris]
MSRSHLSSASVAPSLEGISKNHLSLSSLLFPFFSSSFSDFKNRLSFAANWSWILVRRRDKLCVNYEEATIGKNRENGVLRLWIFILCCLFIIIPKLLRF